MEEINDGYLALYNKLATSTQVTENKSELRYLTDMCWMKYEWAATLKNRDFCK
jgi:hypothetical protein